MAAANLSTSRMIDDVAERAGGRVIRTPVGEANVASAMIEHGCVIGGEGNGGVIDLRVGPIRDSLVGMALVLQLMAETGKSISQLVQEIGGYSMHKDKFAADSQQAQQIMAMAAQTIRRGDREHLRRSAVRFSRRLDSSAHEQHRACDEDHRGGEGRTRRPTLHSGRLGDTQVGAGRRRRQVIVAMSPHTTLGRSRRSFGGPPACGSRLMNFAAWCTIPPALVPGTERASVSSMV